MCHNWINTIFSGFKYTTHATIFTYPIRFYKKFNLKDKIQSSIKEVDFKIVTFVLPKMRSN